MDVWTTLTGSALTQPSDPTVPTVPSVPTEPGVSEIVVDRCADGGVPVVVDGRDAAMGQRFILLTALNCTDAPVVLDGVPAVDFLAEDGQRFDITAEPGTVGETDGRATTAPVTLAPGAAAGTTLSWRNLTEYDGPETAESIVLTLGEGLPPVTVELTVDLGTTHRAFVSGWSANDPAYPAPVTVTVTTTATPTG
nr:DUF4232 domain-containing protein [Nakamurella flavida]